MESLKLARTITRKTITGSLRNNVTHWSAAMAFHTLFIMAPLLVLSIMIAGFFMETDTANERVESRLESLLGEQGGAAVDGMISRTQHSDITPVAFVFSLGFLIFGSSRLFDAMRRSLNAILEDDCDEKLSRSALMKSRLQAIGAMGSLLFVGLIILLTQGVSMLQNIIPGPAFVKDVMEYIFSFIIVSLGVAVLYRTVPDRKTTWESAIIGGAPTAIVFHLAKEGMDIYLSRVNFDDFYGAAGSVFVLFFWVYFAVYIFLMGAQFAAVQAKTRKNFAEKHDNSNGNGDAEPKPLK